MVATVPPKMVSGMIRPLQAVVTAIQMAVVIRQVKALLELNR